MMGSYDREPEFMNKPGRWTWTLAFSFGLASIIAVPTWMVVSWPESQLELSVAIPLWVLITYAGLRLAVLFAREEIRPMQTVFWLFVYIALCLAPLAQNVTGMRRTPVLNLSTGQRIRTILYVLLGCVAYDVGRNLLGWLRRRKAAAGLLVARPERNVSITRLWLMTTFTIVVTPLLVQRLGGVGVLFTSRAAANQQFIDAGYIGSLYYGVQSGSKVTLAIYTTLRQVPALVTFLAWTWVIVRVRRTGEARPPGAVLAWLVLLGLNLVVNNPISNARYWFLTVLLGFVFGMPGLRGGTYRAMIPVAIFLALFAFPYLDYYRFSNQGPVQRVPVQQSIATKDYDQMDMINNGLAVVDHRGYQDGKQITGALFFFVPRSAWPGKGLDTGVYIGQEIASARNLNLSSPMWAEFNIDFGPLGMVLLFVAFGAISEAGDEAYLRAKRRRSGTVPVAFLAVPLAGGYEFILLRGPLLQAMAHGMAMLVLVWLIAPRQKVLNAPLAPPSQWARLSDRAAVERPKLSNAALGSRVRSNRSSRLYNGT